MFKRGQIVLQNYLKSNIISDDYTVDTHEITDRELYCIKYKNNIIFEYNKSNIFNDKRVCSYYYGCYNYISYTNNKNNFITIKYLYSDLDKYTLDISIQKHINDLLCIYKYYELFNKSYIYMQQLQLKWFKDANFSYIILQFNTFFINYKKYIINCTQYNYIDTIDCVNNSNIINKYYLYNFKYIYIFN